MANWWEAAPAANPFEAALSLEGLDPARAALARSIYQQESGSGRNTRTSNAGAVGGMQIIPATFKRMADEGWDINDPVHNARAGLRYINRLYDLADGDPRLAAAGYYGGEGAIKKARAGQAVADPRNPRAPNTLQYADQVVSRLGGDQPQRSAGLLEQAVNAVIPTAQAGEMENWWQSAPVVEQGEDDWWQSAPLAEAESATQREVSGNPLVGIGAGLGSGVGQVALNVQNYLGKGLSAVGADSAGQWLQDDATQGLQRLEQQVAPYKKASPLATGGGELAGNIAATWPVGGLLAAPLKSAAPSLGAAGPTVARYAEAMRTGGMRLGGSAPTGLLGHAADAGLRAAGGATAGGVSAGLVDPESAGLGAAVGGAFPVVAKGAAATLGALGRGIRGAEISDPVRNLAKRAQELGIDLPIDRISNSKPLNAFASSLNYVPFSGRGAVEERMQSQLNRAVSRTFGQESDNVTMALRKASDDLGAEFDRVLKSTAVRIDDQFMSDLASQAHRAANELGTDQARIIERQIDEIVAKGQNGIIDGQAAYNIKRTLDRIGRRTTPEGFYANELKKDLMAALNRSLGPEEAAKFSKTREQYGNMLTLEGLAQNGTEGGISIARLANMRNIRSPDLQEIADIAAQFLRPREGQHGAAQRVFGGGLGLGYLGGSGLLGGIPAAAGSVMAGRAANGLLNSQALRGSLLREASPDSGISLLQYGLPALGRAAPVISAQ